MSTQCHERFRPNRTKNLNEMHQNRIKIRSPFISGRIRPHRTCERSSTTCFPIVCYNEILFVYFFVAFVGHLFSCIVFCCFFIFILLNCENSMVELSLVCDVEDKNQFVGITEHCMAKPKDCASTHTRRSHNVEGNELNDH